MMTLRQGSTKQLDGFQDSVILAPEEETAVEIPASASIEDPESALAIAEHTHTQEQDEDISEEESLMKGYMMKKGHKRETWKDGYFVFSKNSKVIKYYEKSEDGQQKGSLKVESFIDVPDRGNNKK